MRLIDADKAQKQLDMAIANNNNPLLLATEIKEFLEVQPTVEERKHGHWSEEDYRCSVCGAKRPTTDTASKWIYLDQHYCYNCGAAMDEEEENK